MRYLSVCSGVAAEHLAWSPLGWECAGFAEIDGRAREFLKYKYPDVPLSGDFTQITGDQHGPVDLVFGGTPCQSFSVAGSRGGLDDDRGNLALEFCRLVDRVAPEWVVWENVPGVLSDNRGRGFGAIVGSLVELGYGCAWRVLDAQWVRVESHPRAVPQRRRRVFLVGHRGNWTRAGAVLFEPEGLRRHPAPRREAGKAVAGTFGARPSAGGGFGTDFECDGGLVPEQKFFGGGKLGERDVAACLTTSQERDDPSTQNYVVSPALTQDCGEASEDGTGRRPLVVATDSDVAATMTGGSGERGYPNDATMHAGGYIQVYHENIGGNVAMSDTARALRADASKSYQGVVYSVDGRQSSGHSDEVMGSLDTHDRTAVIMESDTLRVRRLMPVECERLMGFPDGYTEHGADGPFSDAARYRMIGNSVAVNCLRWVGERIEHVRSVVADGG